MHFSCEFQGISSQVSQDYCWIHGSSYIPPEYQPHLRCIVEQEGVNSEDDAPDTSYYQWVTFMFCIQVIKATISKFISIIFISGCSILSSLQSVVCPGGRSADKLWNRRQDTGMR